MIDQIVAEAIATRINDEAWAAAAEGKCAHELFPDVTENEIARAVVTSLVSFVVEAHELFVSGLMDEQHMIATLEHGFIISLAVGQEFGKVLAAEELADLDVPDEIDGIGWN